jgi:hypothetical protein
VAAIRGALNPAEWSLGSMKMSSSSQAASLQFSGELKITTRAGGLTGASAGAQLGRDPSLGAIEHRERPGDRLGLAARVVQRGTVEHLDLVLRRRARDLG